MKDGILGSFKGFKGALNQMLTCLGQDLNADIIRDQPAIDQLAAEIEISF